MCTDMHLLKHLAEHIALCIDGMFNAQRITEETTEPERKEIFLNQLDRLADELYQTWLLFNTMFGNITYTRSKLDDVVTEYDIPQLDKASVMTCIAMQYKDLTHSLVKVPKSWVVDWCDHIMTIFTEWTGERGEGLLDEQITQLTKDIREYMIQQNLWDVWYDNNIPNLQKLEE